MSVSQKIVNLGFNDGLKNSHFRDIINKNFLIGRTTWQLHIRNYFIY